MAETNGHLEDAQQEIIEGIKVTGTTDYDLFSIIEGNRAIDRLHVEKLKHSFLEDYLFTVIIVNEKFQIIDGQHRFMAAKELQFPIYFVVVEGLGIKEVKIYNLNQNNWKKIDYLNSYVKEGKREYVRFKKFMEDFPEFKLQACYNLLTGKQDQAREIIIGVAGTHRKKDFEAGNLKIADLQWSYKMAENIRSIKPHYDGYNRNAFVKAMIAIMKHPAYDHKTFLSKLIKQPGTLHHKSNINDYKLDIEDIFNFGVKAENRVQLRYAK